MNYGQRIKTTREKRSMLIVELAKESGVHPSLISRIERGDATGSAHTAAFAHALQVNAFWLQTGKGKEDLDYIHPLEITKTYSKEIQEVIKLMEASDERGREKALIAVKDAVEAHQAWKNSLPRAKEEIDEIDEIAELAKRLEKDTLRESLESETNDVYTVSENVMARKDTRH